MYQGDEGFSTPKVPEGVKLVGVNNMREALQAAYREDDKEVEVAKDDEGQGQKEQKGVDEQEEKGGEEEVEVGQGTDG